MRAFILVLSTSSMTSARAVEGMPTPAPSSSTAATMESAPPVRRVFVSDMVFSADFDRGRLERDARRGELSGQLPHLAEDLLRRLVGGVPDHPVDPGGDLPHLGLAHSAARHRR